LDGDDVVEYRSICTAGAVGRHSPHSAWWRLASIELSESWRKARGWRRRGRISHYLQSWGNGETLTPLCLVATSEHRATRVRVEKKARGWRACARISHYLQSWDSGGTLTPLCVVATREYSFIFAGSSICSTPPIVVIHELSVSSLMARYSLSSSCPAVLGDGKAGLCLGW